LYELGAGGANSVGSAHYVYLPTPNGPMPIATYTGNRHYAVHTDHLNTPRRLTQSNKQVAWQWAFSAFGDEQPTTGKNRYVDPATTPNAGSTTIADVTFNLRYPGQYFDKESGLSYNYFRSYDAKTGRYTQSDPIGLDGGWNKFGYADGDGINNFDRWGLETCLLTTVGPGGIRDHAAIFTSRGDGKGGPAMYDPAGAYSPANLGGSGDIVTGSAANMQKFRDFHKPQTVETSCKNTSRAEKESIINKASDLPSAAPFQCSIRSSTALSGHPSFPNVKPETFWPGNLRRQFK
jgi:RHS repeat-associated protein